MSLSNDLRATVALPGDIEIVDISKLHPPKKQTKKYRPKDIRKMAHSLRTYGWTLPILSDDEYEVAAGVRKLEAAKLLGLKLVPVLRLSRLTPMQIRAYRLADNRLAHDGDVDTDVLGSELAELIELDCDILDTGFEMVEIDKILSDAYEASLRNNNGPENEIPAVEAGPVARPGDLWSFDSGRHFLLCGDAREIGVFRTLMQGELAGLIASDPPYNVKIDGHVSGKGATRHREFAMGAGEMPDAVFTGFLQQTHGNAAAFCRDGAIAYIFQDWRHIDQLIAAGKTVFSELKNIVVWMKENGGMGTFYRSQHELIAVFKVGTAPHINNFGLGETGRPRTNVWRYAGVNSFKTDRADELSMHPTVKPVALVADAIKDCSHRGDIVLDPFGGSGTTLIAAHQTGRRARLIEYDPLYCDVIIRRFQRFTGGTAMLVSTGQTFDELENDRSIAPTSTPVAEVA